MGMPVLGPPTTTPFAPLAPTQPEAPQAPAYQPGPSLRSPGSAYGLERIRSASTQTYEPPAWARTILTVDPLFQSPGAAASASGQQGAYQRPGLPDRVNVNPFGDDPLGSFLGGDVGVAAGMVPGQQRGGAYHGIATAPVTLANFSTWGREGVLALATSMLGRDYQQPENAQFGEQPAMSADTLDEAFVKGLSDFGNLVWGAMDAPLKWFRDSNAFNRGKAVRSLFQTGQTNPFVVEAITSAIFGGQERFTMDALRAAAAREGVDLIDAIAKRYDLTADQVSAIAMDPFMSDAKLGTYTDGSALSVDPVSNMALELAMQGAMLAVGGIGVAKGAAALGRSGVGALEALGTALRGGSLAEGATVGSRAASAAGYLTRRALQLNAWNTTAGWTVRGAEWGIKQLGVIAGNDEIVRSMDRLMWQMPLSMNPGWNLIDGFSSHPIDAYRNLRRGQVAIGRRGTPGYVGQLDLRGLALRDGATGETMVARIAGREVRLGRNTEEFKVLGRLRDLSPDDMHGQFFAKLGWSRDNLERVFGEGNPYDLTWDDLRNALFHVALEAVREGKGQIGRLDGIHLPTMADRTAAFVRDNAKGALKVLDGNLSGTSSSMLDLFRGDFWNLAARNDTRMGVVKAPLGPWDKDMAFLDFASWVRASKIVRSAIEAGKATQAATPTFRRTVNRAYLAEWVKQLGERFGPDDVVPLSFINQLKRFGGAVESRGKGAQLVRGRQAAYTRRQLEEIVDSVIAEDDIAMRAANTVPRDQAAAFRRGIDPGQDPLEDARVAGISTTELDLIRSQQSKGGPPSSMPPTKLLRRVAEDLGRTVDSLLAAGPEEAWGAVFGWYDDLVASAVETAALRDNLDRMAQALRSRASDGRMDPADATAMIAGLARIRDEALAPLDPKVATTRPGLYAQWQNTAQEGLVLAQAIERHLADEARLWRVGDVAPGVQAALPSTISERLLGQYQALIAKVLKDGSPFLSEFDRARLADPATHPFLKHDILAAAVSPTDRVVLRDLEVALGGDPRELVTKMLADGGIDATDPGAGAAAAAQRATAYVEEGRSLGAQAAQLARRFQTLGGAYSDELADTLDRVSDFDAAVRAQKPVKGQPRARGIGSMPMDPEAGARRSTAQVNAERASAQKKVSAAQAALDAAERAVRGEEARPTAFDPDTMEWQRRRVMREKGGWKVNRDAAHTLAAQLRRDEGAITQVRWDKDRSAYVVETAQPKPAAPEPRQPMAPPSSLLRGDDAQAFEQSLDALLAARTPTQLNDGFFNLEQFGSSFIADPAYMPGGELEPLREMVERRAVALSKDLEANPPLNPSQDPRVTAQGKLEDVRSAFARRDRAAAEPAPMSQSALETAAVAEGADPALIDQAVQGRMDLGGTPESGGAMAEGPRTQGGRIVLEPEGEAPQPHGFFPDPGTNEPIGYQLMVVDASQLVTSADEGFDPALQPRMRFARTASDEQIASIAQGPDPARLLGTESGAQGAPVILPDGQVLAGNGRVTGIRQAHADGTAGAYTAALGEQAAGIANPVLVRVIDVDHATATRLAVQLNFETGMPLADQALGLSRLLSSEDIQKLRIGVSQSLEDALDSSGNDGFVNAFLAHIPEDFRNVLKATDGSLNQQGKELMAATLVARFTGASDSPAGQMLVATLFEGDPEVKSLASGMDAIGSLIQAQVEAAGTPAEGVTPAFAADLIPALQRVFDLRKGMELRDVQASFLTVEMFDDAALSDTQRALAHNLALMGRSGPESGAAALRKLLRTVARRVRGHEEAGVEAMPMDLFAGDAALPTVAYPAVVNEVFGAMNLRRPEGSHYLMLPDADGITRIRDASGAETARIHPVVEDPAPVIETILPAATDLTISGNDWRLHTEAIGRSTGRVVINVASDAEAAVLRAILSGDESASLPIAFRVVGNTIEALPEARVARAREMLLDAPNPGYKDATARTKVDAYLSWMEAGEPGPAPAVSEMMRKRIEGALYDGRDPRLPALRDALAGRDFEVRGPSDVAPPVEVEAPAAARPTEVVAGTPRDIDPDFEVTTGLSPETPDADLAAAESAAAGRQRITTGADGVHRRAAQRGSGAPVVDDPRSVIEINAPDAQERLRLAQAARDAAAANLEAARAKLDALGPAEDLPPAAQVLSGSELDLYHRYIDSSASPSSASPTRQPRDVNEVIDLLTSLDLGVPPLRGAMAPEEMETLRQALLRVLNARLDDVGVAPSAGAARRGGAGVRRSVTRGVGTKVDAEPAMTTPEDLSADLADVVRQLQGRVYEAADSLDGWEGTQYEIGMLPTTGKDGGPLAPRIPGGVDWIDELEARFPTLGEELLHGRKQTWKAREESARWKQALEHTPPAAFLRAIRGAAHTAFDSRPERVIVKQSIERFTQATLKHFVGTADEYEQAIGLVHGMIGKVHDGMRESEVARFPKYRRVGTVPPDKFEKWATSAFDGLEPQWYAALKAEMGKKGIKHPLAELWRQNDNRVRAYFQSRPGGMGQYIDAIYDSRAGRMAHGFGRGLTVGYHIARFLMDLRWLGLELVEAPTLTLFQEGPAAMLEGMGRGPNAAKLPMFLGRDAEEGMRTQWAWWLSQSDPGAMLRTRERYLLAIVRRRQEAEFPRALREAAAKSPDIKAAIKAFDGGDEMAWLRRLDGDWELAAKRSQELDAATAERLFRPWFERGTISQKELDELLKAKRYTGHPEIDKELATLAEPWMGPLIGRLQALNEQGWNDAARLIFGQTDRSNAQRLMNHPLLYWPISYQIKATKWLAGLLFDRAFGIDTGAGGAVTLGMIHQQHKDRMVNDPEYASTVVGNPTLLFFAQMLFPITPWDLGVGLSPFTRLAMSALTADDQTEGYRRNIFSVGPGYTYYSLLPRLFYEQSKPGSWGQQAGVAGDIFEAGQRFFPYSVPVAPKSTSELYNAELQVGQGAQAIPQPGLVSPFNPAG